MKLLNEVQRMQQLAGILKEDNQQMFADLVDEIVGKANGDKSQEYDWTKEVLTHRGIADDFEIRGLLQYAIDTNHHQIADACKDLISNNNIFKEETKDEIKKGKSVIYTGPDKKYGEKTLKKGDVGMVKGFEEGELTVDFESIGSNVVLSVKNIELKESELGSESKGSTLEEAKKSKSIKDLEDKFDDLQGDIDHTRALIDEAEEEGDDEEVEYLEKELEKLENKQDGLVDKLMKLKNK